MEVIDGVIQSYDERGKVTVVADYTDTEKFLRCGYKTARVVLNDSRTIRPEQRKKAYALLGEIADYMGEFSDIVKKQFKWELRYKRYKGMIDDFSLSDCSVEIASAYIDLLVETVIAWGIPLKQPLTELCDDIRHYVHTCAVYKKCAVCGRNAELHHVDAVGMGNDRRTIDHIGRLCLPLCRKHHDEIHKLGAEQFTALYHLEAVKIDGDIAKTYKLNKGEKNHE